MKEVHKRSDKRQHMINSLAAAMDQTLSLLFKTDYNKLVELLLKALALCLLYFYYYVLL
ncbi:hypothetical protein YC2023_064921 [Brassica napus]